MYVYIFSIFETFVDKDLFDNSENDDKVIEEEGKLRKFSLL